jgi:hypothetical protein
MKSDNINWNYEVFIINRSTKYHWNMNLFDIFLHVFLPMVNHKSILQNLLAQYTNIIIVKEINKIALKFG